MEKLTLSQLFEKFYKFNEENNVHSQFSEPSIYGVIVFKESNWKTKYSLESRSYVVNSSNKLFVSGCGGNSIYATNLDHTDNDIRLDAYLNSWEIDYCYLLKENTHD